MSPSHRSVHALCRLAFIFSFIPFAAIFGRSTPLCAQSLHADDQRSIELLIEVYFSSWSRRDFYIYKHCFSPSASIYYINTSGLPQHFNLDDFINSQIRAHALSRVPLTEKPIRIYVDVQGAIAHGTVYWQLQQGNTFKTGTDFFTFIKIGDHWRILTLIFKVNNG